MNQNLENQSVNSEEKPRRPTSAFGEMLTKAMVKERILREQREEKARVRKENSKAFLKTIFDILYVAIPTVALCFIFFVFGSFHGEEHALREITAEQRADIVKFEAMKLEKDAADLDKFLKEKKNGQ